MDEGMTMEREVSESELKSNAEVLQIGNSKGREQIVNNRIVKNKQGKNR